MSPRPASIAVLLAAVLAPVAWGEEPPKRVERPPGQWVKLLDSKDATEAAAAEKALLELGWRAVPALRTAGKTDLLKRIWERHPSRYFDPADRYLLTAGDPPEFDPARLSLVWEGGSGHGQTLFLCRADWVDDEFRFARIEFSRTPYSPVDDQKIRIRSATLARAPAEAALEAVVRGLAASLIEKKDARGGSGTTADFHARVRIRQDDRQFFDEGYTGYISTWSEPKYYRPRIAGQILAEAVADVRWKTRKPNEADLAFLLERSARHDEDGWWVRERFLLIVEAIGDERFLPFLQRVIESPLEDVVRRHLYAIDAYAKISGVDFRPKRFEERHVKGVRGIYLRYFEKQAKKAEKGKKEPKLR